MTLSLNRSSYWAFISYSHSDSGWARWLHRGLERYRVPRRLVGQDGVRGRIPQKLFPVFLDREELAGSSALGPDLEQALRDARHLIVICSPQAARSRWVNEEIKYFKALGKADRILALIVDGEPHASDEHADRECFPPALRHAVDENGKLTVETEEPVAADARPDKDGKSSALLKLLAGVLGVGFDDLRQRDLQTRHRRMAFVAGLASVVAAVTVVLALLAMQARDDARRRQAQAEDLIEFMLGDLRQRLEAMGRLDVLEPVGDKAMDYFATLDDADRTDQVLGARARALRQIGDVRLKQGHIDAAVEAIKEALSLDAELLARHPRDVDTLDRMGRAAFSLAGAYLEKGRWDAAEPWVRKQLELVTRLTDLEPEQPTWQAKRGDAISNLGAIAYFRGEFGQARRAFSRAAAVQRRLYQQYPDQTEFILPLVQVEGWLASIAIKQRQWSRGQEHAGREQALLERMVRLRPDDVQIRYRLSLALMKVLYTLDRLQPLRPEALQMQAALQLTNELAALDPSNILYRRNANLVAGYFSDAWLQAGDLVRARQYARRFVQEAQALHAGAPDVQWSLEDWLEGLLRAARLALLADDAQAALVRIARGRDLLQREDLQASVGVEIELQFNLLRASIEGESAMPELAQSIRRMQGEGHVLAAGLALHDAVLRQDFDAVRRWYRQLDPREWQRSFVRLWCQQAAACGDEVVAILSNEPTRLAEQGPGS